MGQSKRMLEDAWETWDQLEDSHRCILKGLRDDRTMVIEAKVAATMADLGVVELIGTPMLVNRSFRTYAVMCRLTSHGELAVNEGLRDERRPWAGLLANIRSRETPTRSLADIFRSPRR